MMDDQYRIVNPSQIADGLIRCENEQCGWPLAYSLGRSLVLGAVVLRSAVRLGCVRCGWGTQWHPAPKEKTDKKIKARTPPNPGLAEAEAFLLLPSPRIIRLVDKSAIPQTNVDKITC